MRTGFTIGETMVATLILGIVLAAVMTTFLSAQRMLATSMAESELALASRGLREKLLFHAAPAVDGVHYAGMLSGTNSSWVVETGSHNILMQMGALGTSLSDVRPQSVRIIMGGSSGGWHFVNEHIPNWVQYAGWLWPRNVSLVDSLMSDVVSYETLGTKATDVYRVGIDINLMTKAGGVSVYRRERVSVPLMGRIQPMKDISGKY